MNGVEWMESKNGWMDGWMDGWTDGRTDRRTAGLYLILRTPGMELAKDLIILLCNGEVDKLRSSWRRCKYDAKRRS